MSNKTKIILLAVLIPILVVLVLIGTHVVCIFHEWMPATCMVPETCKFCDAVQGDALGHKWVEAACETAKTCEVCGEVEGQALGHDWAEATCLTAKTCNTCGKTEGEPAGHQWQDATCTEPKTCSGCGETEGEALGHVEGEPTRWSEYPVEGYYCMKTECSVCGCILNIDKVNYISFVSGDHFYITPKQLMERCNNEIKALNNSEYTAGYKMIDGKLTGLIWNGNGQAVFAFTFVGTDIELIDDENATNMRGVVGLASDGDTTAVAYTILAMIRAADPRVSLTQARNVGDEIVNAAKKEDGYTYYGIKYILGSDGSYYTFGFALDS